MQTVGLRGSRLSIQQTRIWELQRDNQAYWVQCALTLEGPLYGEMLRLALDDVIRRHEILRTAFQRFSGMEVPIQVINSEAKCVFEEHDLQNLDALTRQFHTETSLVAMRENPRELACSPVVHAILLRESESRALLLLSLPALCADVTTLERLTIELVRAYAVHVQPTSGPVDDEILQYVDFSTWQNEILEEEDTSLQQNFWVRQDLPLVASWRLPFSQTSVSTREGHDTFTPQRFAVESLNKLSTAILECIDRLSISPEAFFLACWQILLWRLTGEKEILVGVACDGRSGYEELADVLGPCTRVVPLVASFGDDNIFEQVLTQIQSTLQLASETHLYFSWDVLSAHHGKQLSGDFFPVSFEFGQWPTEMMGGDVRFTLQQCFGCTERFLLKLVVWQVAHTFRWELHYDATYIQPGQVQRVADALLVLLQFTSTHLHTPVSHLPILEATEQERLLQTFRGPERSYSAQTLQQLFEEQVERTPEDDAVVCGDQRLTYQQLNARANQLAFWLKRQGIGSDVLVCLCVDRSMDMLIGLLAVLKAGGAYVPLDPDAPLERLAFQLEDTQAPILLTQEHLLSHLPTFAGQVFCLDKDGGMLSTSESTNNPLSAVYADSLAYVIYTSGSTGIPKGVRIRQSSVVNYTCDMCERIAPQSGLHFATVSTLAADLGNTVIFSSLVSGGCLHILSYETLASGESFANYVERYPIDVLKIVPSHLQALLTSCGDREIMPRRYLISGGETLSGSLLQTIRQRGARCAVMNHYGPTETTIGALVNELGVLPETRDTHPIYDEISHVPVGFPISNVQVCIVDQYLQIVPVGVVGELLISGAGLAAGYLHQTELTQERFSPHPLLQCPNILVYKTGDLAQYTIDDKIELIGRTDRQVKLRGYRIELEEIETALLRHPYVYKAAAILREDVPAEKRIVAYVVSDQQVSLVSDELRSFLQEILPEYMVPALIMQLPALPLTPNGKLDYRALPIPEQRVSRPHVPYVAPRSPIEDILVAIWQEMLQSSQIGIHDNFFATGGNSLLVTRIISRIKATLRINLPVISFFEAPTVAKLSRRIEEKLRQEQGIEVPPIVPVSRSEPLPLSFAQQRLWFLDQLEPGNLSYNKFSVFRLRGSLQIEILERSLKEVIRRHEVLRTTFQIKGDWPVQVIGMLEACFVIPLFELNHLAPEQREIAGQHLAQQEVLRPFDLAHGPLLRATLLRMDREEYIMLLAMHHIVSDDWSNNILLYELSTLYNAFVTGKSSPLPELPVQYADFAAWQRRWLEDGELQVQLDYWTRQLSKLVPLELPTDRPRSAIQTFRGAYLELPFPMQLSTSLKALSQREGVTLFMTLLAAFQVLLFRYTGQTDISVGTPIANRTRAEIEGLIGFFVNTLVLRSDLSGDPSFLDLLSQVRRVCLEAYAHQDAPFEKLVEVLQPERSLNLAPLFQIMFGVRQPSQATQAEALQDVVVATLPHENRSSKFDLTLTLVDSEQGLSCSVEFNTDLFEPVTIEHLIGHLQTLLEGIVADPQQRLSALPVLTVQQRRQLLFDWNPAPASQSAPPSLLALFAAQVQRTPEVVALVSQHEHLTYQALNRLTTQLAGCLRTHGVGPEVLVGVCLPRGLEVVLVLLAIWKAGGGAVLLDPATPSSRLAWQLSDAGVALLLSVGSLQGGGPTPPALLQLEEVWAALARQPGQEEQWEEPMAEQCAYVIYTSGSSGRPKGVQVAHRGLGNLALAQGQRVGVRVGSRVAQFASWSFDASISELAMSLGHGATLHLCSQEGWQPGPELVARLAEEAITVLTLPPSALAVLPTQPELPQLECLLVAGEACWEELLRRWEPGRQVWNAYGPTEATVCVSMGRWEGRAGVPGMGGGLEQVQVYVLDGWAEPVPIGVVGEVYVGGVGVARGYVGRGDWTAERFVPHRWSEPGARLYRTGDLARWREDGTLEYVGRRDSLVKVRGYRIELGEIEGVLREHEGVRECVVVVREEGEGEKEVEAYVGKEVGWQSGWGEKELRRYLRERLPEYLVPSRIVVVEALPRMLNGKVDRKALSIPGLDDSARERSKPRNSTEFQLQYIWEEVLNRRPIGVTDNFFKDLGGHSILAVRLMAHIQRQLGQDVALSVLFERPTIAELAVLLRQQRDPERWPVLAAIQSSGTKIPFFCVHPAGGTVLRYYALARRLGADQPFYGLQTPDLDGNGTTYDNLSEMAAHYIAAMQSVQAQGPYLLGGWSLGGVVAFEMAQQLQKQGHEVACLALLDSVAPYIDKKAPAAELDASDAALVKHLIKLFSDIPLSDEKFSTRDPQEQLSYILELGKAANRIPEDIDLIQFRRFERMQFINLYAVHTYVPEVYPGRITLFRAKGSQETTEVRDEPSDLTLGWEKLAAQGIDVHIVQGDHTDIVDEPNVESLAKALQQCLERIYSL